MSDHPTLVLRCRREHFHITGVRSLMHTLREVVGPKPPPHPMVLGTVAGVTLRRLQGISLIGREITIPAPHLWWPDVPPERWPSVFADALRLAAEMEMLCEMTGRPHDPSIMLDACSFDLRYGADRLATALKPSD